MCLQRDERPTQPTILPEGRRVSTWGHPTGPCTQSPGPTLGDSHPGCPKLLRHIRLFATPWTAARKASLSIINPQSLLKLKSIESVMPSNHLIFCFPVFLLPSIFPSIRVFSNESALCIRWPKCCSFSFSISPSNEYSGLISVIHWIDLLAVQGTLKVLGLLQHHSLKVSVLRHSAFLFSPIFHCWNLLFHGFLQLFLARSFLLNNQNQEKPYSSPGSSLHRHRRGLSSHPQVTRTSSGEGDSCEPQSWEVEDALVSGQLCGLIVWLGTPAGSPPSCMTQGK